MSSRKPDTGHTQYVYFVKHIYFKVFEFIIGGKNKTGVLFLSAV